MGKERVINPHLISLQHSQDKSQEEIRLVVNFLYAVNWVWLDSAILGPNLQFIVSNCFNFIVNLMPRILNLPISNKRNVFFMQSRSVHGKEVANYI